MAKKKQSSPVTSHQITKGFKVFNPDFSCRGFQFEENKEYTHPGKPELCANGFHFCKKANHLFNYYQFDSKNIVCEVEAVGEIMDGEDKSVTVHIKIGKRMSWTEVLAAANLGKDNSGHSNSGDSNSGHSNSGDSNSGDSNSGHSNSGDSNSGHSNSGHRNSGDSNSGHSNSGHRNSGDRNSGHSNSGDRNSGHSNSGDRNSGHSNSGDWNSGKYSNGLFNTKEHPVYLFDQPSDWTYSQWLDSEARMILSNMILTEWVYWDNMTDEEKAADDKAYVRGGYLKKFDYKEACQTMWKNLKPGQKKVVMSLPNFSWTVFTQITGIQES